MRDANNTAGYSIVKSYKPLVAFSVSVVVVSDILFIILLLFIIGVRSILGLDAELIGLTFLLFIVKSVITAASLYTAMRSWLGVTYFVHGQKLYIQSNIRQVSSGIIDLKDVHKATVKDSYRYMRKTDYGDVVIDFNQRTSADQVILQGVKDPQEVANLLLRKA
jgi:hypothetical protein